MIFCSRFLHFTKNFLVQLAIISLIFEQFIFVSVATAQTLPITPDGSTNTQVTQTASGVDQINIAAPNANGMSHNTFDDYNVNNVGQIINNFSGTNPVEISAGSGATAVTQTQIGGFVTANSNLASSGSAKVILNEVTSGNVSQLLGYTEIAGTKADLILANPNGIACNGCGFINTARLLMMAGSSNFDANGNLGFNLKEQANPNLYVPLITIDGLGLDVTRTTGTDIIASSVKLLSSIYGNDSNSLTIKTGEGRYDYATKNITGINIQNNASPVFAIDASALAKIQAGQIYLIATKQGVGVKMESEILALQTLNIDANGDIYYKRISVGDTASLKSSSLIQSLDSSSLISAPNLNIQASEFKNLGIASAKNLNVQDTATINNFGNLEALNLNLSNIANINNQGSIFGQNSLAISGTNLTNNLPGKIYSPLDYTITLTGLLINSGLINSGNNLTLNSNQLFNSSEISTQNNLTFLVTDSAINSGNLIANNALNFTANSFTNSGVTQSNDDSNFNLSSLTNAVNSSIYSAKALNLNLSSSLNNSGSISSLGNLSVTRNSAITNSNQILSNSDVSITASSLNNNANSLIASLAKSLTISLTGDLQNDGNLNAITDISISSANFNNSGTILAGNTSSVDGSILSLGNLTINSSASFINSGSLQSTKDTDIISDSSLSNSGLIKSLAKATINTNLFTNQLNSEIAGNDDLAITVTSLNNFGSISSQNNFTANSSSINNQGSIYSKNNFRITNASDLINSGTFYSDGSLAVLANNITNNSSASIFSNKDISLISNLDFTNSGNLQATKDLVLTIGRNTDNSGNLVGNQLTFSNYGDVKNSGYLGSENDIILSATNFTNSGLIKSLGDYQINLSGNFDNQSGSTIYASKNLNFNSSGLFTNLGEISANERLTINTSSDLNNSGNILSNAALSVFAANLSNNSSSAIASLSDALTLTITNNLQNNGQFSSATDLGINGNNLTNAGDILAGSKLTIDIENSVSNSRNLQSVSDFSLTSTSLTNSGTIKSFGKSEIISNSINNQDNGLIFSALDSAITSYSSFTNSGSVLSSSKLDLTSSTTANSGEIFVNGDLSLVLTNNITNSGNLSSLGNLKINSNSDIINTNQILSNGTLSIAAANLNSSYLIQSNSNLSLNVTSLNSSNKIVSGGAFNITTSGDILNGGILESTDNFTINADSFYNSANSLILARGDLNIRASIIDNQNTKPSTSIITSGIVSANGAVNIVTDTLNNNSGLIVGKSTSVDALNAASINLYNTLGAFISTASISLDLGNIDYTITGNLTASNVDITANNITNQGNVTASDFIKLNATGNSGISESGNIINGFEDGDNSNVKLAAGSYVDFNAKNNINNYGIISASTDLTLSSTFGSINNYNSIIGGNGTTTVNAPNGVFNNNNQASSFTANNNAIFNVRDLNNTGGISVANNLTANIANNLNNNPTALIWSGDDAIFNVANTFLNNEADIYADRNLTIQKNTSSDVSINKTSLVQNISGDIETYGGDINIKANTLQNKRSYMPTQGEENEYRSSVWYAGHGWHTTIYYRAIMQGIAAAGSNISSGNNLTLNIAGNLLNDTSSILTKNNATINVGSLSNNSYLFRDYVAVRHWDHNVHGSYGSHDSYDNDVGGFWYTGTKDDYVNQAYIYNANIKSGGSMTGNIIGSINNTTIAGNIAVNGIAGQSRSTTINHIDAYTLEKTGVINVDLSSITSAISSSIGVSGDSDLGLANTLSSIARDEVSSPNANASSLSNPSATVNSSSLVASGSNTIFSGNFKINLDPSSTNPLVESRSQFTDASKFFGSSYYFDQLGLNGSSVLADIDRHTRNSSATRILGDSFVETKLILDQLKTLTNDSLFLSKTTTDPNQQIKELLDNSVNQFAALGLNAEDVAINGLTTAQANSLTKDIVTFELTKVNGIRVLAPKLYLSQGTRNRILNSDSLTGGTALANSSTIFGKDSLTIDSPYANLFNVGSIVSSGNLNLNLASLTNKTNSINTSQIIAGNNLSITANIGDIKNIGANMGSVGALSLAAVKGNILNTAIVQTDDANLLSQSSDSYKLGFNNVSKTSGNIHSELLQNASIKGGSISINAANDFTNLAANISTAKNTLADGSISSGNLAISAGNNVNIATLQLHNRSEVSWGSKKKGGISITDTASNIGSNISSANDLSLTSTGLSDTATNASINIIGSNVNAAGNGSLASDFGNINIANAVDSKMTQNSSWKKGSFSSRSDSVYDYKESAVESKLNFGGNLTASAELGEANLIGSTVKTGGNLNVGNFTIAQNTDGSYKTNTDGTFQTVNGGSVAGVNIKAAELKSEHSEFHQKSKFSLGNALELLVNPIKQAKMVLDVAQFVTPVFGKQTLEIKDGPKFIKSSSRSGNVTTTQHSATLDVGSNLMVNSTGDFNITASNVSTSGNALLNVDGNINIVSAVEATKSGNENQAIEIGTFKLTKDFSHASASASISGTGSKFEDSLTAVTQKASNINIGGSLLTNVTNNLTATDSGNLTLTASNLTVGGDSIIKTTGDFSLTDAQNTSSHSSKESTLTVEVGVKVGNAYVDAAYAWKAVADAQKKAIQAAEKLNKMEDLKDNGKATDKAVKLASAQVVLAQAAVVSATLAASAATAGAGAAASTSLGTGFYGAGYVNTTSNGVKNTTDTSISKGSSFIGYGDINIASNNNANIIGSMLSSINGNVALNAAKDINIEAGTNTLSQTSKQETIYEGGSVGNNGIQINVGLSTGQSDYNKIFYTNSIVNAENSALTLTTENNANISGANLLAKNLALNIGNNLNVSSKQTEEDFSSNGFGLNFGAGVGAGGNGGNIGDGFNMSSGNMHRLWVDDINTIKGNDSMAVNVGKDLNLTGAAILSDNLALAVSSNINQQELNDIYYSESMGIGLSTNFTTTGSQPTIPGTGGKPNQFPGGSTSISGSYAENESSRAVYATIGGLDSILTSATKDVTGGDFEGSIALDHRLLSKRGRANIASDFKNLGTNINKNPLTPMGASVSIEDYTGQELSWKPGDVARFKEKGKEFETAVVGANTIGMANTIDPTDPKDADRLHLIGQPLSADLKGYKPNGVQEGGGLSTVANSIDGMNSMSVFHDKFTEDTLLGAPILLQLSIIPAIPINYYGLIGKELRSLYEQPKNNKLTGGVQ